jgi:hypothetical protein
VELNLNTSAASKGRIEVILRRYETLWLHSIVECHVSQNKERNKVHEVVGLK